MQDWNELRLALAVQRAGSLTGAATALSIDHSTAFRRLKGLEERIGVRLFERLPGGAYAATEAGERMAAAAERMEDEALALDRAIAGVDHKPAGRLRVTCSETLAFARLTGHLAAFRRAYPGIVVELAIENRVLSLTRREADVALRPVRPREGDLWGRTLAGVAWTVYGAPDLVAELGPVAGSRGPRARSGHRLGAGVRRGWQRRTGSTVRRGRRGRRWSIGPGASSTRRLPREGIGLALLPCYLGDAMTGLVRALAEPVVAVAQASSGS